MIYLLTELFTELLIRQHSRRGRLYLPVAGRSVPVRYVDRGDRLVVTQCRAHQGAIGLYFPLESDDNGLHWHPSGLYWLSTYSKGMERDTEQFID